MSRTHFSATPAAPYVSARAVVPPRDGRDHEAGACTCGFSADHAPCKAYNEETFSFFLRLEYRRALASNRPFLLLLVRLKRLSATTDRDRASGQRLMTALSTCVRETDFIGWRRGGTIAGAVLTQHSEPVGPALRDAVSQRVIQTLHRQLPAELAERLHVRVYQLPASLALVR